MKSDLEPPATGSAAPSAEPEPPSPKPDPLAHVQLPPIPPLPRRGMRGLNPLAWPPLRPMRNLIGALVPDEPPLELQIIGRTLLHAALVGLLAGLVGSAFLSVLEWLGEFLLVDIGGYNPLRTASEAAQGDPTGPFRWYFLILIPAVGGLLAGYVSKFAPEVRGGGGDAAISAFHNDNGKVRRRVLWAKPLASIGTLATGGAGGREGPTMQIGAAIGAVVGRYLTMSQRERRTLMVAGVAAGISAVFRTPLGAALLAIEVLYKDDFESEALIPAVLASVIAYSVALSVFGTEPLFGTLPRFPFHPTQLPLFVLLALVVSVGATMFHGLMHAVQKLFAKLPGPVWIRPAIGGLGLGLFVVAILVTIGPWLGNGHKGLGVFGGGYGAGQLAIVPPAWLAPGWTTVRLLLLLAGAKMVASALTIGSGGSAGDFAPSIAIGGLLGGAFGMAAQVILDDKSIQPGAFALVGMAAFYAGIANTPLAALVMVSEVAGSYDLLVPLMLTEAIALIALRKVNLYRSQPRSTKDSPVHQSPLANLLVGDIMVRGRPVAMGEGGGSAGDGVMRIVTLALGQSMHAIADIVDAAPDQDVFPVVAETGRVAGLLAAEALRGFVADDAAIDVAVVADVMVAPLVFAETDDVRKAALALVKADLRQAPVIDREGKLVGLLDQHDIVRALAVAQASPGDSTVT